MAEWDGACPAGAAEGAAKGAANGLEGGGCEGLSRTSSSPASPVGSVNVICDSHKKCPPAPLPSGLRVQLEYHVSVWQNSVETARRRIALAFSSCRQRRRCVLCCGVVSKVPRAAAAHYLVALLSAAAGARGRKLRRSALDYVDFE